MWEVHRNTAGRQSGVAPDVRARTVFFTLFMFTPGCAGAPQFFSDLT
jgi:hypothetical protein